MKKLFTTALALLAFKTAVLAQTVTAVGVVTLTGGPSTPMEVAYNPTFNLYYASAGGYSCNNLSTWPAAGGSTIATVSECYDARGLWWNSLTNTLEGNSYNSAGIYTMALSGTGIPTGVGAIASTNQQPDPQAGGQFDPTTNQVLYYFSGGTIKKHSRSTGLLVSTITITGLPVAISNLATYGFYTGITGSEYAVYDYVNRRAYLINYTTGAYVSTVQFPATASVPSSYNISYCNNKYFLCDGIGNWVGYSTTASALNFDGSNDIVSVGTSTTISNMGLIPFTLEAWVYPTNTAGARSIFRKEGDYNLYLNGGVLTSEVFPAGGTGGSFVQSAASSTTVPLNQWSHVALVWTGSAANFYINGVIYAATSTTLSSGAISNLNIGMSSIFGNPFLGSLDELRIWNVARTKCQINTFINCEIPTTAAGLVANYHFNQGVPTSTNTSVTTLIDASGSANTGTLTNFALTGTVSNWVSPGAVSNGYSTSLAPLAVGASLSSSVICNGQATTLNGTGANTYTWTGGVTNAVAFNPTVTTNYVVTGTSTLTSCTNTAAATVSVNASPSISVNSGAICAGTSFTMVPSGGTTYTFSSGSAVVTPTATASYSVSSTNTLGCVGSAISNVTVNALPTVSVTSGAICAGNSFTMVASGASTYTYSSGSAVVTPTTNANYNVTGTSAGGCVSSNTAVSSITVNVLPTVNASTNASLTCTGQTATLTANGASTYTWNTSATTAVIVINPTVTTTYTVNATGANGCANVATVTQNVSACTGINALTSNSQLFVSVYPNPSNGEYTVELLNTSNVSVVDVLGKIIYTQTLQDGKHSFNLNNFNNGLYILKVESNGDVKTVRLVKN